MSDEIRVLQDSLTGRYSTILREFTDKPNDPLVQSVNAPKPTPPPMPDCKFCPEYDDANTTTYSVGNPWQTRAITNKWFFGDPHNVVLLSNKHIGLYDLEPQDWVRGFDAFRHFDKGRKTILFAANGPAAGASQLHAHAQILNLEALPVDNFEEKVCATDYDCILCFHPTRAAIVFETKEWLVVSPTVPQLTGELRLISKVHRNAWVDSLAEPLVAMVELTGKAMGWQDFSLVFHVTNIAHAHVHILPRKQTVSVLELGWHVNTVKDPFTYAEKLRNLLSESDVNQVYLS